MVREWLQWVVTGRRRRSTAQNKGGAAPSGGAGCMCAVFQLFDLQHHPLSYQPAADSTHVVQEQDDTSITTTSSKGVEAPRNSLEVVGPPPSMKVAIIKEQEQDDDDEVEDNSNFPVGINQIKTRASPRSRTDDHGFSSDCSPGTTKTPNLVARLMGLDLLPEAISSPSLSGAPNPMPKARPPKNRFSDDDIAVGARTSSARKSDFEYHRLSLQITKENTNSGGGAISGKSRGKSAKFKRDESTSPARHFAKQLVNQVKERVMSRRVGLADITNTDNCRGQNEINRRDQNLVLSQHTRNANDNNYNPKRKTGEPRTVGGGNENIYPGAKKLQLGPRGCEYSVRDRKLLSRDEAKTPDKKAKTKKKGSKVISSEHVSLNGPTALPVRKDPSPPATKLPQKQSQSQASDAAPYSSKRSAQLSRNPSRSYLQSDQISTVLPDSDNGSATAAYGDYVRKILKRAGINDKLTPLALGKWRTPSHPLDPSIFYYLELFAAGGKFLSRRSNRKLIFQLVDELLAEILKPYLDFNLDPRPDFDLCAELCRRIGNFPAADCRVLEDIDFLIDRDFCKVKPNEGSEEEGEGVVSEIEGEIMEWLLRETVAVVGGGGTPEEKRKTEGRQLPRAGEGHHVMRCY